MEFIKPIHGTTPSRADWCRAWLVLNRIQVVELAKVVGVSRSMDHVLVECLGNRVPVVIIDDVRLAGEANLVLGWTRGQLFRLDPYPGWEPGPDAGDVTEVDLDAWERWTDCYAPGFGELDDVADCIVSLVEVA